MIEVRIHGRGGQGGKTAAQILARAAYLSGFKTQDFAMYGAERKGAPVISFARIDKDEIRTRGYIFEPDYIVVLDESVDVNKCMKGAKPTTQVIINTKKNYSGIKNSHTLDATKVAMEKTGRPIPNVAILGAIVRLFGKKISFSSLVEAIKIELSERLSAEVIRKNIEAAKECFNATN